MPTPKELYEQGELKAAIEALGQELRSNPADVSRRIFLFELLCFAGEWDRAEKQIDAIGSQSPEAAIGVAAYRDCIKAERQRARLFTEALSPHFLTPAPDHVRARLTAIQRLRDGDAAGARELLEKAEDERPALIASVNGTQVDDFRDWDDFVAPVLELFHKENYVWMPLEQVRKVEFAKPKKLRDLVWPVAKILAFDGTEGEVFAPCLYAGSSTDADELVRLGRMTDWRQAVDDVQRAVGMRTFLSGDDELPMTELRVLEISPAPEG